MSVGPRSGAERDPDTHGEFMRLARASLARSYRTAAFVLGDRSEAEDAVQEALVLAWRGWAHLRDASRFEAWFDRILINACYERLRGRRRSRVEALPAHEPVARDDPLAAAEARDVVGRALGGLTAEQLLVVVLRYWRDLSVEEIAERARIPAGTVRSRLHYALQRLRAEIDPATDSSAEVQP